VTIITEKTSAGENRLGRSIKIVLTMISVDVNIPEKSRGKISENARNQETDAGILPETFLDKANDLMRLRKMTIAIRESVQKNAAVRIAMIKSIPVRKPRPKRRRNPVRRLKRRKKRKMERNRPKKVGNHAHRQKKVAVYAVLQKEESRATHQRNESALESQAVALRQNLEVVVLRKVL
jgi:hypothetical protein